MEQLIKHLHVKISEEHYEWLKNHSRDYGMSMAELVRECVTDKIVFLEENSKPLEKKPNGTLKDPYPSVGVPKSSKDYFNSNPEKKPQKEDAKTTFDLPHHAIEVGEFFNPQPKSKKGKK